MSEFVKGLKDKENDLQYNGNAFLRMLGYLKPYMKTVLICFVLVGLLTALELYRPNLIGNAIDKYITTGEANEHDKAIIDRYHSRSGHKRRPALRYGDK